MPCTNRNLIIIAPACATYMVDGAVIESLHTFVPFIGTRSGKPGAT